MLPLFKVHLYWSTKEMIQGFDALFFYIEKKNRQKSYNLNSYNSYGHNK